MTIDTEKIKAYVVCWLHYQQVFSKDTSSTNRWWPGEKDYSVVEVEDLQNTIRDVSKVLIWWRLRFCRKRSERSRQTRKVWAYVVNCSFRIRRKTEDKTSSQRGACSFRRLRPQRLIRLLLNHEWEKKVNKPLRRASEMERWTGTPEGTRTESCGRFGKRTPFLRWQVQLHRMWGERSGPKE